MMGQDYRNCIVCDQEEPEGIFIFDSFVCRNCEAEMIKTDTAEDKYMFFIKQMRQIWLKQNA